MEGIEKRFPGVHALKNVNFDSGFYWYDKTNIDDPKIKACLYE
jgi:hypothetical protein